MEKTIYSKDYEALLRLLREARERAGLTQVVLAEKVGQTQSFVSKVERGERRLDVLELRAFCGALGTTLAAFVEGLEAELSGDAGTGEGA